MYSPDNIPASCNNLILVIPYMLSPLMKLGSDDDDDDDDAADDDTKDSQYR